MLAEEPTLAPDQEIVWKPLPGSQEAFLSCPLFEVLYEGTRGPGKTDAMLMDFGQFVGTGLGPSWQGIIFRQTFPQLKDVINKTTKWFPRIWPDVKYNASNHIWTWPDGEQLLLRAYERIKDYDKYHGHEFPWIGWEELCNWADPEGYLKMMSICRSSDPKIKAGPGTRYRSTTNPSGPGHNWVKDRWRLSGVPNAGPAPVIMDSYDEEGELEKPRVSIHGTLDENTILLAATPDYKQTLRMASSSEAQLRAWLYGDWDIVAGGMFDDVWDKKVHAIPMFNIPRSWRIDRAFDWGSSKPFSVGWWAESDGSDVRLPDNTIRSTVRGDLFRIMEWYGWTKKPNKGLRMLATEIAWGIIDLEVRWGLHDRIQAGPADSSIFTVENGSCIADDMKQPVRLRDGQMYAGVHWDRADKSPGSRLTGWEMMRKMLKQAKIPTRKDAEGNTVRLPREDPGLFIFETCEQFIRTVPTLPRDARRVDDVDTDAEDHIGDETRYRVTSAGLRVKQGTNTGLY